MLINKRFGFGWKHDMVNETKEGFLRLVNWKRYLKVILILLIQTSTVIFFCAYSKYFVEQLIKKHNLCRNKIVNSPIDSAKYSNENIKILLLSAVLLNFITTYFTMLVVKWCWIKGNETFHIPKYYTELTLSKVHVQIGLNRFNFW